MKATKTTEAAFFSILLFNESIDLTEAEDLDFSGKIKVLALLRRTMGRKNKFSSVSKELPSVLGPFLD